MESKELIVIVTLNYLQRTRLRATQTREGSLSYLWWIQKHYRTRREGSRHPNFQRIRQQVKVLLWWWGQKKRNKFTSSLPSYLFLTTRFYTIHRWICGFWWESTNFSERWKGRSCQRFEGKIWLRDRGYGWWWNDRLGSFSTCWPFYW